MSERSELGLRPEGADSERNAASTLTCRGAARGHRSQCGMDRIRQWLVGRFWNRTHADGEYTTWPQEPVVRRRLNRRVTGSEDVWPMEWLAARVKVPFSRALSLGCGEGALERDLMAKGLCQAALGLDLSERAVELARRQAEGAGYSTLEYRRADLNRLRLEPGSFDAAFSHQALHHVRELEACLQQVAAALVPGGLVYADEYVGPSRHEWRRELLAAAQEVYRRLPPAVRRRRRLQLPVDWRDPSEAVRSSEVLPLLAETFDLEERRDYGGNLLAVIYPHLRLDRLEPREREELLLELLDREEELLAAGSASFYTLVVAVKRTDDVAGTTSRDAVVG